MRFMWVFIPAVLLTFLSCSAATKSAGPSRPVDGRVELPAEALDLLNKSQSDSCAVCARESRREAFRLLDARLPPGAILKSDSSTRFVKVAGENHLLMLSSHTGGSPEVTFRFHTTDDHLVGIDSSHMTDEAMAGLFRSSPEGTRFQGILEIVPYEYGDGPGYIYLASSNHVQFQCRLLELRRD